MTCKYIENAVKQAKCERFKPNSLWRCKHIEKNNCPIIEQEDEDEVIENLIDRLFSEDVNDDIYPWPKKN